MRLAAPMSMVAAMMPPSSIAVRAPRDFLLIVCSAVLAALLSPPDLQHIGRTLCTHAVVGEYRLRRRDHLGARKHHGLARAVLEVDDDELVLQVAQQRH